MAGATWNCCRVGAFCVHHAYNHAPCHFMQSHIRHVHACLAVACHLHLWQNDRDLLRATAVTRGWNGCRNKSQHRKLITEKKILPPLLRGFEPATFQLRVCRSNHWAIPAARVVGDKKIIGLHASTAWNLSNFCIFASFNLRLFWQALFKRGVMAVTISE